jgi:CRP/FNR family transcriptional regulator, cyclic AMP receptor protein
MNLGMSPDDVQEPGLGSAIASFRAGGAAAGRDETLWLPDWRDEDWNFLFGVMDIRKVLSGDALIRGGEPDRTLYFVLRGELEIIVQSSDGLTMGRVARVGAGAVLGELAFFDGGPRSATAWAVTPCEVAAMSPDQYAAFELASPELAHTLLFALGRILATRLRRTNAKLVG